MSSKFPIDDLQSYMEDRTFYGNELRKARMYEDPPEVTAKLQKQFDNAETNIDDLMARYVFELIGPRLKEIVEQAESYTDKALYLHEKHT